MARPMVEMRIPDESRLAFLTLRRDRTESQIAWIVLNDTEARNAWSEPMIESFINAVDMAEDDPSILAVIITGEGRAFCSGGNVKQMLERETSDLTVVLPGGAVADVMDGPIGVRRGYIRGLQRVTRRLDRFDKPLVACVNGAAIGAGLDLALMCDARVVSTTAVLGSTFVKLGLLPGDGGAYLLQRVVGFPKALELQLTGRIFGAVEAEKIGLANATAHPHEVHARSLALAVQFSAAAPLAVGLTKRAIYRAYEQGLMDSLEQAATMQGVLQCTPDHFAGLRAVVDKTTPTFKGVERRFLESKL